MNSERRKQIDESNAFALLGLAIAAGLLTVGPVTLLAALALEPVVRRRSARELSRLALPALGFAVLLLPLTLMQVRAALDAALPLPELSWPAVWPPLLLWWLLTTPAAPALAWLVTLGRPRSPEERLEAEDARAAQRLAYGERRAGREIGGAAPGAAEAAEASLPLGRKIAGEPVLPVRGGQVELPPSRLARHALVLGATRSGKTETLLRLAYGVAQATDWSIFYLDAKGDRETMRRFGALMADTGRSSRRFPDEPYDGWRGSGEEIANRLTEVIDFAEEGGGTYFRDQAIGLVRLACEAPAGPPRSEAEFKERLALGALRALYRGHPDAAEVELYAERQVAEVRARYATFFGPVRGRLDSGFAFEDTNAGYLLLDGVRLKRSAQGLTRLLIEDFKQFAVARKDPGRRVLLILDEFSRVPGAAAAAVEVIETTAGFGAAMVLAPQMVEGMGSYEDAARIIGSVGTTFLHRVPNPERITAIAGTRREIDRSVSYDDAGSPERSSARYRDVPKVDPNHVRQLGVGACFVIAEGRAMRVQIAPAPQVAPELVSTPSGGLGQPG